MSAAADLIEAADALADLIERTRPHHYETENYKRWVLGPGGKSGNCEICVDNADAGPIPDEDVFEGVDGDVDGPPAHPNCECDLEYVEKRVRVYDD